jgi:hypothetical protein
MAKARNGPLVLQSHVQLSLAKRAAIASLGIYFQKKKKLVVDDMLHWGPRKKPYCLRKIQHDHAAKNEECQGAEADTP